MTEVSVVIPVFNKFEFTRRCLDSLLQHSTRTGQVLVIDNASTDATQEGLREFHLEFEKRGILFQVLRNESNLGYGRACNQGIRLAQGSFVAVLNNDTWLAPDWDGALIREVLARDLDLIGPHFDERPWSDGMEERAQRFLLTNANRFREHFVPILLFFPRKALEKLKFPHGGIFDERFFVTYEDTDLQYRMRDLKMRYGQTSNSYLWHVSMGTRGSAGALPSGYEQEGLRLFIEKWGVDPRISENRWFARWKRRFRKWKSARGRF